MDDTLSSLARSLGRSIGSVKREVDRQIGKTDIPQIVPYRGYANRSQAHISCRVLRNPGLTPAAAGEAWWRNLLNTYKRIETDQLPGASVRIRGFGTTADTTANDDGYVRIALPVEEVGSNDMWRPVEFELLAPLAADGQAAQAVGHVVLPSDDAAYGVISDLDDTVIRTDVHSITRMLRTIAVSNAHTRLPFHGVAAFYNALHAGRVGRPVNPIFYVSSCPWNLYDLLDEFLEIRGIPAGPLILREWGLGVNPSRNAPHKLEAIAHVLDTYTGLPFILIGDSGQEDPEIYREIIARYPGRVCAAYIRNVTPHPERSSRIKSLIKEVTDAGSTMVLADDTLAVAQHAVEHGWIEPAAIDAIKADEAAEDKEGPASDEDTSPTIIVDPDE
ncbi:MAG: phosphatase domain-containing protein [Gemmatimonadota bacterium]